MTRISDDRIELARAMSVREVMERVPLPELKRAGRELVGPCPACGGDDRFSINLDRNVYNCRSCGGGDAIGLAELALGTDFLGAVGHLVGEEIQIDPKELARRKEAARRADEKRKAEAERYRRYAIEDARKIWCRATTPRATLVEAYLARRAIRLGDAIPKWPASIRFLPDHPYVLKIGPALRTLHRGPCMITAIQGRDDRLSAVHQTWLDLDRENGKALITHPETGEALDSKMCRGSQKGAAMRLGGVRAPVLIMGEGIETTLSARMIKPELGQFWAAINMGNFSGRMISAGRGKPPTGEPDLSDELAFVPPPWVERLVLIQDGDSDPEQTRAHLVASIKRARHHNPALRASIVHPGAGKDLNDLLRSE